MKEWLFSINYHYLPGSSLAIQCKCFRFCSGPIILVRLCDLCNVNIRMGLYVIWCNRVCYIELWLSDLCFFVCQSTIAVKELFELFSFKTAWNNGKTKDVKETNLWGHQWSVGLLYMPPLYFFVKQLFSMCPELF